MDHWPDSEAHTHAAWKMPIRGIDHPFQCCILRPGARLSNRRRRRQLHLRRSGGYKKDLPHSSVIPHRDHRVPADNLHPDTERPCCCGFAVLKGRKGLEQSTDIRPGQQAPHISTLPKTHACLYIHPSGRCPMLHIRGLTARIRHHDADYRCATTHLLRDCGI